MMPEQEPAFDRLFLSINVEDRDTALRSLNDCLSEEEDRKRIIETSFDAGRLYLLMKMSKPISSILDKVQEDKIDIDEDDIETLSRFALDILVQLISIFRAEYNELLPKLIPKEIREHIEPINSMDFNSIMQFRSNNNEGNDEQDK